MAQITKKRPFLLHAQLFGDKQLLAESPQGCFLLGEKKITEYSVKKSRDVRNKQGRRENKHVKGQQV